MFIRTQPGGKSISSQPSVAQICDSTKKQGRNQIILTNLSATTFYIKLGPDASDGLAGVGGNWDFILAATPAPAVVIDNWTGIVTCDPPPAAGDINVAEMMGSTYP